MQVDKNGLPSLFSLIYWLIHPSCPQLTEIPDWTPLELSHISCDPNKDSFQILLVGIGPLNCLQPGSDFSIPPCHPSTWPPGLESQRHAPGRQVPDRKEPTMLWGWVWWDEQITGCQRLWGGEMFKWQGDGDCRGGSEFKLKLGILPGDTQT